MQNLYNRRPNTLTINNHKNPENTTHINALELPKEKWDKLCPNGFNTYHCYRNTGLKAESKRAMIAILDKILATHVLLMIDIVSSNQTQSRMQSV